MNHCEGLQPPIIAFVLTDVDARVIEALGLLRRLIVVLSDWLFQNSCNKKQTRE
jgi:hypothetical protein